MFNVHVCRFKRLNCVTQIARSGLCEGEAEACSCIKMTQLSRTSPRVLGKEVWLTNTVRMWQHMSCSVATSASFPGSRCARRDKRCYAAIGSIYECAKYQSCLCLYHMKKKAALY